ncbi:hypothetical protein FPV67DRAFT_1676139 [Lyophyllum atratum]|nr:hypothetical protein FPV67DRAFT_1676139 [Lyophyllum atratum]
MTKKQGTGRGSTGRHSWVKGSKLEFFEAREEEFFDARDAGPHATGNFYHKMARLFMLRWGWDLPFDEDGPVLVEASESSAAVPLDWSDVDEGEQEERSQRYKLLQKNVGQWFRYRFTRIKKTKTHDSVQQILEAFQDMSAVRPRKQTALHLYSNRNYKTRFKKPFDELWNTIKDNIPKPTRVTASNEFVRQAWLNETEEYRLAMEKETETLFQKELNEYKGDGVWTPRTPEEYDQAMADSATTLIPFADAIAQRLGVYVTIMLCGPMAEGKVELRSIHSTTTGGRTSKIWPELDPDGYSLAQTSITAYGNRFFAKEDIEARKLGTPAPDGEAGLRAEPDKEAAKPLFVMQDLDIEIEKAALPTLSSKTLPTSSPSEAPGPEIPMATIRFSNDPAAPASPKLGPGVNSEGKQALMGEAMPKTSLGRAHGPTAIHMEHPSGAETNGGRTIDGGAATMGKGGDGPGLGVDGKGANGGDGPEVTKTAVRGDGGSDTERDKPEIIKALVEKDGGSDTEMDGPEVMKTPVEEDGGSEAERRPEHARVSDDTGEEGENPGAAGTSDEGSVIKALVEKDGGSDMEIDGPEVMKTPVEEDSGSEAERRPEHARVSDDMGEEGENPGAAGTSDEGSGAVDKVSQGSADNIDLETLVPAENRGTLGALTFLKGKEWGPVWTQCLHAWITFEAIRGFPREDGRLATQGRPAVIGQWMKGGRRWVDQNVGSKFAAEWAKWWHVLKGGDDANVDWESLNKGGSTGLVLVVLGLAWWGEKIEEIGRTCEDPGTWLAAVRDVIMMLDGLLSNQPQVDSPGGSIEPTSKSSKRKLHNSKKQDESPAPKKKRYEDTPSARISLMARYSPRK